MNFKHKLSYLVVILVIIVVASIMGISSVFGAEPSDPVTSQDIKEKDGSLIDAELYAKHWGVSIDEAFRRFKLEDAARPLDAELSIKEADTFAGLWIEHTPDFKIVAAFTGNAEETVKPYLTEDISGIVETHSVKYSYAKLQEYRNEFEASLRNLGISFDSVTDIKENRIEVDIAAINEVKVDNALEKGRLKLPENIQINIVEELAKPTVDIYGGRILVGFTNQVTSGFAVKKPDGTKGIATVAHANDLLLFYGLPLLFQGQSLTGSYDVQWHTCPLFTVKNKIRYWDDGSTLDITATRSRSSQLIGETVSKYGGTTGYTAGNIFAKDATLSYVPNCAATFIQVYNTFDYEALIGEGDSGGPWFRGNTAYGISCAMAGPDWAYYMAINYVSVLGVSVMTSP